MNKGIILNWLVILLISSFLGIVILGVLPITIPGIPVAEDVFTSFMAIVLGFSSLYLSLKSKRIDELELVRDRRAVLSCKQKFHGILEKWLESGWNYGLPATRKGLTNLRVNLESIIESCGVNYPPIIELCNYISTELSSPVQDMDVPEVSNPIVEKISHIQRSLRYELEPILRAHGSYLKRGELPSRLKIRWYKLKRWIKEKRKSNVST
jgi:hypothetical protein